MFYIYLIYNQITEKIYVGKSEDPEQRFSIHKTVAKGDPKLYKGRQFYIHKAMKKYGEENFFMKVVDQAELEEDIFYKEKYWVSYLKKLNFKLYNLTDGGEGPTGLIHSEESKRKMSQNHEYKYGLNHPLYGIGHSQETKNKMSKLAKEEKRSVGNKNPMFGKIKELSPAFGRVGDKHPNTKISDNNLIVLKQEIESGNFLLKELAAKYNVSVSLISQIKNNKRRKF